MDKLKLHTPDKAAENFAKLATLFPNAVTETIDPTTGAVVRAIDKDILMQEISTTVVEGREERYQFTWPDKRKAILAANAPIQKTLRPCREESAGRDGTAGGFDSENLYIEGDNLEVLKLLQETYLGKVKMIYIDPPYNTGNDFVYEDDFSMSMDEYSEVSGQTDEEGNRLFKNTESNGRFHTDWLNMIYPRLKLARDLLTDDGVILISIDDCEEGNLKKICDEIFGEDNFVDTLIWKKRYGGGAKEKYFVSLHEYVLVYCKNVDSLGEIFVPLSASSIERYYSKKDSKYSVRGGYRTHPLEAGKAMDARPNLIYPIPAPDGSEIYPKKQWLWGRERTYEAVNNGDIEIVKGKDGAWVVSTKQYLRENDGTIRMAKMLSIVDDVYTQHGTNEMIEIFADARIFSYPKPSAFAKQLVSAISDSENDIILDFFSGSATTAHAVMQLNAEDGGNRKFIMVQLPEATDEKSEAYRANYKTICEIGKERIRRAGKKIAAEVENSNGQTEIGREPKSVPDIGFRVLKCDSTNMKDVYYNPNDVDMFTLDDMMSNIKEDRTPEDLLFQVMLDLGVTLSSTIKETEIMGKKVYAVGGDYLMACFDDTITEEVVTAIAKQKPYYYVMRDSSMANDSVATNFEQIFETYSKDTIRKVL